MSKGKWKKKRWWSDKVLTHPAFRLLVALNIVGALFAAWLYFNQDQPFPPYAEEPTGLPEARNMVVPTNTETGDSSQTTFPPAVDPQEKPAAKEPTPAKTGSATPPARVSQVSQPKS